MAALTSTAPFQNALKPCGKRTAAAQRRALVCRAQNVENEWQSKLAVPLLAAGLAATTLLGHAQIAEAGVVFKDVPSRKVFQGGAKKAESSPPPAESSDNGGGGGGVSLPSLPSVSLPSIALPAGPDLSGLNVSPPDGLDVRAVALPGAILGIAGIGLAAYRFDAGFRGLLNEGLAKDSTDYAGYERAVDEYASEAAGKLSKGTKKISKAAKQATKKGTKAVKGKSTKGSGVLGGLFSK